MRNRQQKKAMRRRGGYRAPAWFRGAVPQRPRTASRRRTRLSPHAGTWSWSRTGTPSSRGAARGGRHHQIAGIVPSARDVSAQRRTRKVRSEDHRERVHGSCIVADDRALAPFGCQRARRLGCLKTAYGTSGIPRTITDRKPQARQLPVGQWSPRLPPRSAEPLRSDRADRGEAEPLGARPRRLALAD